MYLLIHLKHNIEYIFKIIKVVNTSNFDRK